MRDTRPLHLWVSALVTLTLIAGPAPAEEQHFVRQYRATANITLMGLTVFTRTGVGGGWASLDLTGAPEERRTRIRFLSGSTPERAHGLNRLGFIEERLRQRDAKLLVVDYFGFITANREKSVSEARAALQQSAPGPVDYVAAESAALGPDVRYRVHDLALPSQLGWANSAELLQQASAKFRAAGAEVRHMRVSFSNGEAPATFLYALIHIIQSSAPTAESRYFYNGKVYNLRTEKTPDVRTGKDLMQAGLLSHSADAIRVYGHIRREGSSDESEFRLWLDSTSPNPLPVRFEYRPRSYLHLVFDAQPIAPGSRAAAEIANMLPALPEGGLFPDEP